MPRWLCFLLVALILIGALVPSRGHADVPVVDILLFYSESCPHCHAVITEFLPGMREKYGDRIQIEMISIDNAVAYQVFTYLDDQYGIPPEKRGVPEMFIGKVVMIGRYQIEENFEQVVDQYLAGGGADTPSFEELRQKVLAAYQTPAATQAPAAASVKPVHMAYFHEPGCRECDRAEYDLRLVAEKYPNVDIEYYSSVDDAPLAEWLGERYGVPEAQRLAGPALFVGEDYLFGSEVTLARIEELVQLYSGTGAPRVWENWEQEKEAVEERVVARYRSFGLLTVAAAGLIDGINPCAFATLVFLVSYLAITGRGRRQIMLAGVSFTLGVFATYLVLGLGLYRLVAELSAIALVSKVVYGLTACACLVLAVLSMYDFIQARRGQAEEMALRLPNRLRRRVNRAIRESMGPGTAAVAALMAGIIVASVELACTGQVYLPTIMFVASRPELQAHAAGALALYNAAFVVPLVLVFVLAALGTGSQRLRVLLARHTATVKLITAILFVALAAWLVTLLV